MNIDNGNSASRANALCGAILAPVDRLTTNRLGGLAVAAGLMLTLFGAMGMALEVDADQGMMSFLDAGKNQRVIASAWDAHGVWWLAVVYLVIDAVIFVPIYGALLIALAPRVGALHPHWPLRHKLVCSIVVFALAAMLADEVENILGLWALLANGQGVPASTLVWATKLKWFFFSSALGVQLIAFMGWFFALGNSSRRQETATEVVQRARLRFAVVDIVWRSRYVIASLAFFAAIVLVMNQSRDVLAGVAQGWQSGQYAATALAMLVSAVSVWALAYTCWMWTRILCRLRRPVAVRQGAGIAGQPGGSAGATASTATAALPAVAEGWPLEAHQFAQWWARLLGAAPVLMLVWLCGFAAQDAVRAGALESAYLLLAFGVVTLIGAVVFLWGRSAESEKRHLARDQYYECKGDGDGSRGELHVARYRFLGLAVAPLSLPVTALLLLLVLRLVNLWWPDLPPVTLAVICCAMTLWAGVVGLLTQLSLRRGLPVMGGLLILVAGLGWWGITDNHMVWNASSAAIPPLSMWDMWTAQAAIGIFLLIALALTWRIPAGWRRYAAGVSALLTVGMLPTIADHFRVRSGAANQAAVAAGPRPTVDKALIAWLGQLCKPGEALPSGCSGPGPLTVYFVSAEGGGIRAAYWPALVLAELAGRIPDFDQRTFSLSGVSGGAVGASVYRACRAQHSGGEDLNALISCIRHFGATDLLTPLLGSWMFEDVLARFIPTRWCAQPGCGVLSRGAWFERGLEKGVPDLRLPLTAQVARSTDHLPHLFLNSTWVETGERAIASDVRILAADFPTARDQIDYLGSGLPVSTAAHNAARFPFVNAIGSVRIPAGDCPSSAEGDGVVICGHLADGGYFDNSGGHTTGDILRALRGVLRTDTIAGLDQSQSEWLRAHLVAQVIMIRNGVDAPAAIPTDAADLPCDTRDNSRPRCAGQLKLFADFLGPVMTAFNTIGTGANGRLAESLQAKAVQSLRPGIVGPDGGWEPKWGNSVAAVVNINLEKGNVMYPLGWYLSLRARCSMEDVASHDQLYTEICANGVCPPDRKLRPTRDSQCVQFLPSGG